MTSRWKTRAASQGGQFAAGNVNVRFSVAPKEDIEIDNAFSGITVSLPESSSFEIVADCHSGDIDSEFQSDSLKLTSGTKSAIRTWKEIRNGRGPKIIPRSD